MSHVFLSSLSGPGGSCDVDTTIVNGNVLMEGKRLTLEEEEVAEAVAYAQEKAPQVWARVHSLE
jgi:hypothetical protein